MPPVRKVSRNKTQSESNNSSDELKNEAENKNEQEKKKSSDENTEIKESITQNEFKNKNNTETTNENKLERNLIKNEVKSDHESENKDTSKENIDADKADNESEENKNLLQLDKLDQEKKSSNLSNIENASNIENSPTQGENVEATPEVKVKRGRGRPRKSVIGLETPKTPKAESPKKNYDFNLNDKVRPESDIKLRRRDKLKGTERYSPEIHEPVRRGRRPMSFPSTSTSAHKYINLDSDEEQNYSLQQGTQLLHTKKMLLRRSTNEKLQEQNTTGENESKTYLVNVKKEENEVILMMPDGTTLKIENKFKQKSKNKKITDDEEDEEEIDDFDYEDDDYKINKTPNTGKRKYVRKALKNKIPKIDLDQEDYTIPYSSPTKGFRPGTVQATGIKMSKQVRKATKQQLLNNRFGEDSRTTKITTPTGSGKTVTYITTPKSVTVTPTNTFLKNTNTYIKRNYGSNAKYLNETPELSECTFEEINPDLSFLPDKILLVNSDLPLVHSLNNEKEKDVYLYNQIVSPIMSDYKCLLCVKNNFREEEDLVEHYSQFHELSVDHYAAKFSEETVFVCLPRTIIGQINNPETSSSILLNAPCQYCGDAKKLATADIMKTHYKVAHMKEIKIVEQEEILEMYQNLYCSICSNESTDFRSHHKHMKETHKMYTFVCKMCLFTTKDAQRLITHYRAKHLMSNKTQNLQCTYCNGILIGHDRMNKHIMTNHCVQTGPNEYSCTFCLQPCDKSEELLAHSYKCQGRLTDNLSNKEKLIDLKSDMIDENNKNVKCFLCDKSFKTNEKCMLHLNHVHTKWVNNIVVNDTFLMVQHKDGKTDLMPNNQNIKNSEANAICINNLPSNKELEEIGAKTQFGYYCVKCECVIKIYQLFYLHMHNFHKMSKQFECKINSCKQTFKSPECFKEHIEKSGHPQKSVIEDPLLSIACHNCDAYFINNKDIEQHNLSDEHYIKLTKNIDKSGAKSEARNFKCKTCHTWFGLMDSFIYHMENESHKHGCPHCGLHFALPSSRRTHIQSVHADRADICELCNEKQGTKERLFAHLVTHNLVFECNKCMRKFYQREQLNNHMETHGEPLNCPWPKCERQINRTALSNHIRQHKVENSLKCYACDKLFQNKALLAVHIEVHSMADQNAKVILASANNSTNIVKNNYKAAYTNSPTMQTQKAKSYSTTTTIANPVSQPVETTLISITTPSSGVNKQRTYTNRVGSIGNKISNQITKSPTKYQIEKVNNNSKIMCYTCNQIFSSHNELSYHRCVVPEVTITGPNISAEINSNQIVYNETNGNEIIMEQVDDDPQKKVLDLAAIAQDDFDKNKKRLISSSHNRFMESNKKTYDIQNRARKTYSSLKNKVAPLPKPEINQIYVETQSDGQPTQIILTESGLATLNNNLEVDSNTVQTIQALIQEQQIVQQGAEGEMLQIPIEQQQLIVEQQPSQEGQEQTTDNNQYIVIQQPDGQYMQICIPEGMDVDDVIKNLNFTWPTEEEQQTQLDQQVDSTAQFLDSQQLLEQQQLIADQQNQMLAEQQQLLEQQQINIDASTVEQLASGEQQVIYLPVNEDGTCAIDAESLAMLTGNGDMPIIVSSSN